MQKFSPDTLSKFRALPEDEARATVEALPPDMQARFLAALKATPKSNGASGSWEPLDIAQRAQINHPNLMTPVTALANVGRGVADVVGAIPGAIRHPINTARSMWPAVGHPLDTIADIKAAPTQTEAFGRALSSVVPVAGPAARMVGETLGSGEPMRAIGQGATMAVLPKVTREVAIPAVRGAPAFAGRRIADSLGITTGAGAEAIKTAFKEPTPAFYETLRGNVSEVDIVTGFKDALTQVKDSRAAAYRQQLAKLPPTDLTKGVATIKAATDAQLSKFGIKRAVDSKGNPKLDFSRSTIHDRSAQSAVANIIKDVDGWGGHAGDASVLGVDTLKRRVGDFYSDSSQARAFVQGVKSATTDALKAVPGYEKMTKGYATASEFIGKIEKEFSLGQNANLGTTIRKISYALKQNNEYRRLLVEALDGETGSVLKQQLSGYHLSKAAPRGLMSPLLGSGLLGAIYTGALNPAAIPALLAASPRFVGEVVAGLGKATGRGKINAPVRPVIGGGRSNASP